MAKLDPAILAHLEWLGFVQPTGLVVSAPALVRAGAILNRHDGAGQELLRGSLDPGGAEDDPLIADFEQFARTVLGWNFSPNGYAGTDDAPIPAELELVLHDYGETLRPDYAVRERNPIAGALPWQLLVSVLPPGADFDAVTAGTGKLDASAHGRLERLLRQTGVPAGLLFNGRALRLISAPRGESSGWLDFPVTAMAQNAGRPICSAIRLLLGQQRLLTLPPEKRLAALLADSRAFQNEVSEKLAEQVLHALYELLRGFQAAHDASSGDLLRDPLNDDPDDVYRGLLTVILRLVFLLYAEEREMLPTEDETFARFYSLAGLFQRLRDHAAHFPDTMDQRYGAWAQLLVLFRMVHDGAQAGDVRLPPRHGGLFDPDRYPFLEGRASAIGSRQGHQRVEPPRVPDGTIFRALEKLLVLDGERLSYRALDVEQIGSVYQTMMGFRLETATGRSLALKAKQRSGAPTAIDLDVLLATDAGKRARWVKDHARELTPKVAAGVKAARSIDALHSALASVVDVEASPDVLPKGAMVLQPSDERRKSGSHYTPRTLTEPIVRTTLRPVLDALRGEDGAVPRPEQILELKICDPAMGSAAFLVETCRQLADALIEAWAIHGGRPPVPPDEDEVILARRLIAQRCLYGLDRNPVAVDLAKMSLWLATLAREHALTFLDHALHEGDALVGLSRRQIVAFHWDATRPPLAPVRIAKHLERVAECRAEIREAGEEVSDFALRDLWDEAQHELEQVRLFGDLAVLAFFDESKPKDREATRDHFATAIANGTVAQHLHEIERAREDGPPLAPFHWEIEFPEVFDRDAPGFDAFVGNPPFAGQNTLATGNPIGYLDWLKQVHEGTHGNADLVAHFFRRAFGLLRPDGTLGLIATNTISQGDTRSTGLRWICAHGGEIYEARRRVKWPGLAAVIVTVVHAIKGDWVSMRRLDGHEVETITAYLFHAGGHDDPTQLAANHGLSFMGTKIYGQGFTFDDADSDGVASPLAEMHRLIAQDPANGEVIFPYIGWQEVANDPTQNHRRWVINFGERSEDECRRRWPALMDVAEARVRPERMKNNREARKAKWWLFGETTPGLFRALGEHDRVLVTSCSATPHFALAFQPANRVFAHSLAILTLDTDAAFCAIQARPHEVWARFFSSSMKDDLRYTPDTAFKTFPFPDDWQTHSDFAVAGRAYYDFRAEVMISNDEGLTKTYNRFHDPEDDSPGILELRKLHAAMDRAVLDAFGWTDTPTDCDFFLDYEDDDDEGTSRKRKPYRYRWPDDVHDEVLARLLALNAERAAEEQRSGAAAAASEKKPKGGKAPKVAMQLVSQPEALF